MPSAGVLYIASGEKYIRSAIRSAGTVREHCPGLSIHLFADWQERGFTLGNDPSPFDSVAPIENPHRRSKVDLLSQTPFDWTLYLDTDTAVRADIREMFRLMERFDIAMSHAHHRHLSSRQEVPSVPLPKAFPRYNAGIILYRKTPDVLRFLGQWQAEFHAHAPRFRQDQVTLRFLLWKSALRLATLPPEYNVRSYKYHLLWSRSEASTKIFHLRRYHLGWFAWLFKPVGKLQRRLARRFRKMGITEWLRHRGGQR